MASHRIAIGKNDNAQEPINNRLRDPTKLFNSNSPYTLYIGFLLLGCRTDRFENVFYPAFYRGGGRSQSKVYSYIHKRRHLISKMNPGKRNCAFYCRRESDKRQDRPS